MNKLEYGRAVALQRSLSEQAHGILGRFVGSSLSFDRSSEEWVVNLTVTRKVSTDEAGTLQRLAQREGIRLNVLDDMQPARLASG